MLTDVNRLCRNVNAICVDRDQVIEKLKITLDDFKLLTSYYVEEEEEKQCDASKRKNSRDCTKLCKGNKKIHVKDSHTTNFGQQLVNEAYQIIS